MKSMPGGGRLFAFSTRRVAEATRALGVDLVLAGDGPAPEGGARSAAARPRIRRAPEERVRGRARRGLRRNRRRSRRRARPLRGAALRRLPRARNAGRRSRPVAGRRGLADRVARGDGPFGSLREGAVANGGRFSGSRPQRARRGSSGRAARRRPPVRPRRPRVGAGPRSRARGASPFAAPGSRLSRARPPGARRTGSARHARPRASCPARRLTPFPAARDHPRNSRRLAMTVLQERTPLHVPALHTFTEDDVLYAVDHEAPNWIAVDARGGELLRAIRAAEETGAPLAFGTCVARWAADHQLEAGKAWLQVHDFLRALDRAGMLSDAPFVREPYPGRAALIEPAGLRELWLQINNACNLTCTHCLVSSGPGGAPGIDPEALVRLVDRAKQLGMERLYVTGGEPFLRKDLFDLAKRATETHGAEMIVLTNATVFHGRREERPRIAGPLPREVPGVDRRGPPRDERPDPRRRHVREGARRREAPRGHGLRRLADDGHDRGEPLRARRDPRARQARRREEPAPHVEPQARPRGRERERFLPRERPAPRRPFSPSRTPPDARARRSTTWRRSSGA